MGTLSIKLNPKKLVDADYIRIEKEILARILSVSSPIQIIIFGSIAERTATENSDLDIAVLFSDAENLKKTKKIILNSNLFMDYSVDLLFYSIDTFEKKSRIGGICSEIKNKGKVLYDQRAKV